MRLAEILPADVRVRIVQPIAASATTSSIGCWSEELKFDFDTAFCGNIAVTATDGEMRAAADWVGAGGRARSPGGSCGHRPGVSGRHRGLRAAKGMKEPWCLPAPPTNPRGLIVQARRWEIEGGFRDTAISAGRLGSMHVSR